MRDELLFHPPDSVLDVTVEAIKPRRHGSRCQQLVVMHSRKNNNCLRVSPTVLDLCLALERRRDVQFYQPTPYVLSQPSQAFRYTPAMCAYGEDLGLVFFETIHFMSQGYEDALALHEEWLGEMGYPLHCCQPSHSISYYELQQWRYLYSYSLSYKTQRRSEALEVLKDRSECTVQMLLNAGVDFCDIAYQLFYGDANADLSFPITRTTSISLSSTQP